MRNIFLIYKHCYYTSSCIRKQTLSLYIISYNEKYTSMYNMKCLLSLYIFLYNKDVYFSLYIVSYNEKYAFMYNKNICCHYIRRYIMTTNISCVREMFVVIIHRLV